MLYTSMLKPDWICYRLNYWVDYDPESVWALVQRHNGYISVQAGGVYEFWINCEHESLLLMAYPRLVLVNTKSIYV